MSSVLKITFWLCLIKTSLFAQPVDSLNYGPEPRGGITKLAVEYLKIDFTPAQRALLDRHPIELIFNIDTLGIATLEDVNFINDAAVIDSLKIKTNTIPRFYPRTAGGEKVNSLYFLMLEYPRYERIISPPTETTRYYTTPRREDFEEIITKGRTDILIGGVMNGFGGSAQDYLSVGGGFKMDLIYIGKRGYGAGLVMSLYGNNRKKDFPITANRQQDKAPTTMLIGLALDKSMRKKERQEWIAQLELAYALQNISSRVNNQDKDYIQFRGFSPGVSLHYLIRLGKEHISTYYYRPTLYTHHVNLHAAIRPLFFDSGAASGILWEAGVSYRMQWNQLESFRLKE